MSSLSAATNSPAYAVATSCYREPSKRMNDPAYQNRAFAPTRSLPRIGNMDHASLAAFSEAETRIRAASYTTLSRERGSCTRQDVNLIPDDLNFTVLVGGWQPYFVPDDLRVPMNTRDTVTPKSAPGQQL